MTGSNYMLSAASFVLQIAAQTCEPSQAKEKLIRNLNLKDRLLWNPKTQSEYRYEISPKCIILLNYKKYIGEATRDVN